MKRRVFKVFAFLLAGAIINVAVAWAAVWRHQGSSSTERLYHNSEWDLLGAGFDPRDYEGNICGFRNFGATTFGKQDRTLIHINNERHFRYSVTWLTTAGWPMRSLVGTFESHDLEIWHFRNAIATDAEAGELLPCLPVFPGFAINTIFYAAIVWFLFFAPGAVRRRVRRKRGQCATCGYSLRESASEKCPECGATE